MKNVAIVDDHQILREGLVSLIRQRDTDCQIHEFGSGEELLSFDDLLSLDLIILDVSLPEISGLEVLRRLQAHSDFTANVIILSIYPEEECGLQAIELGAAAYLSKSIVSKELFNCLDAIHNNGVYISPDLLKLLSTRQKTDEEKAPHLTLSAREMEVLVDLAKGFRLTDIADRLFISIKTVSTYKTRIFDKLGIETIPELILYCIEHRIISYSKATPSDL